MIKIRKAFVLEGFFKLTIEQLNIMNQDVSLHNPTRIYAVFGDPIGHSLSPLMHNAAFKALNLDAVYIPCHVVPASLSNAVNAIKALQLSGVNVTIPYKQAILPYLDKIIGDSVHTGSVNTILCQNGVLLGTSTDGIGFIRSLREDGNFEPKNKQVLLIGAGGSAFALAYRLILSGVASITCFNRNPSNAENLKNNLFKSTRFEMLIMPLDMLAKTSLDDFDLIINTTSVGLTDENRLISKFQLHQEHFVYDVVYKKGGTCLICDAKDVGCRFLDGLSMLVYQGAESFRLWLQQEPPLKIMKNALRNFLGE